jgi:lambda family phage portal protein
MKRAKAPVRTRARARTRATAKSAQRRRIAARNLAPKVRADDPSVLSRGGSSRPIFSGAARGRRTDGFYAPETGPLSSIIANGNLLRARSRSLMRNAPWAKAVKRTWKVNAVGVGDKPRFMFSDRTWAKAARQLWDDWVPHADAHGEQLNYYGLQALVMAEVVEAGEIFVRFRPRRTTDGFPVPFQLQLLESEHVPYWYNMPLPNGGWVHAGIEYSPIGDVVAYHLFPRHPGEYATFTSMEGYTLRRIPASRIIHIFDPERAESVRGFPWLAASILRIQGINEYDDAELDRQRMIACISGVIQLLDPEKASEKLGILHQKAIEGRGGGPFTEIEPGTIPVLGAGESFEPVKPAEVGARYVEFQTHNLRAVAVDGGAPYETITGDLTKANYSSLKFNSNEFRRNVEQKRQHILDHQFNRQVAERWMDAAVLSGALSAPDYESRLTEYRRIAWIPQGWPWLEPAKEIGAAVEERRAGFTSRARIIAERTGEDAETIEQEIVEEDERADATETIYDSDPRRVAKPATGKTAQGEETQVSSADKSETPGGGGDAGGNPSEEGTGTDG